MLKWDRIRSDKYRTGQEGDQQVQDWDENRTDGSGNDGMGPVTTYWSDAEHYSRL